MTLLENLVIASGALSISSCCIVFLSYFIFHDLQSKHYVTLVLYLAICCCISSVATLIGLGLNSGSVGCWFQGMLLNYSTLASVLWILAISYQLYLAVVTGSLVKISPYYHFVCWVFPIFTTLLPLTTNTYGQTNGEVDVCFVTTRNNSPKWGEAFWSISSFFIWLWISITITILGLIKILFSLRSKWTSIAPAVKSTILVLGWYPFILIICWGFTSFSRMWYLCRSDSYPASDAIDDLATVLPVLQGFLTSCALFFNSAELRRSWRLLLTGTSDRESFISSYHATNALQSAAGGMRSTQAPGKQVEENWNDTTVNEVSQNPTTYSEDEDIRFSQISRLSRFLAPVFSFNTHRSNSSANPMYDVRQESTASISMVPRGSSGVPVRQTSTPSNVPPISANVGNNQEVGVFDRPSVADRMPSVDRHSDFVVSKPVERRSVIPH